MIRRVGFIGLGNMGYPMCLHLMRAGFTVSGYDIVPEKIRRLQSQGLRGVGSPKEAAQGSDVVITILMRPEIIEEVLYAKEGVLSGAAPGTILIDMSTMSPAFQRRRFQALREKGMRPLEAPVSGSVPHAEEGVLTVMVAGNREVYEECLPLFRSFGKTVVYLGAPGMATLMKLLTNLILGVNLAGLLEGLLLGEKAGLKVEQMLDILVTGAAFSRVMEFKRDLLLTRDFVGKLQGSTELLTKDIRFALEAAEELLAPLPHGALLLQQLLSSAARGNTNRDYSSLLEVLEEGAGIQRG